MKVFLTGATGFIGSAIVPELIGAGHQVLGLTRSNAGRDWLIANGAEAYFGNLDDLDGLRKAAGKADGIIHCAFESSFAKFKEGNVRESMAIDALGSELIGSDRPLVITSVVIMGIPSPGQPAEEDYFDSNQATPLRATEKAGSAVADQGVNVSVVRLPQVHSTLKQGIAGRLIQIARQRGASAYVGAGTNRWSAAHLLDVAHLYRLVLEKNEAGRYHAVAEEGVPLQEIAEVIGKGLQVPVLSLSPEEAQAHFGPLAMFVGTDLSASSQKTQHRLGWLPSRPGLLHDLEEAQYS